MLRPALVFNLTVFTMLSPPFAAAEGQGADHGREIKVTSCPWSSEIEDFKLEKAVKASEWIGVCQFKDYDRQDNVKFYSQPAASLLPEPKSKWIIFLCPAVAGPHGFDTYRGRYGRLPATKSNLEEVKSLISL